MDAPLEVHVHIHPTPQLAREVHRVLLEEWQRSAPRWHILAPEGGSFVCDGKGVRQVS